MIHQTSLENLLQHLGDEDRTNFTTAISQIGAAFAARTTIEADPTIIAALPQVREHVMSGGGIELDVAAAIEELKQDTSISNQLIAAEVRDAENATIQRETENMSRQERMTYARERGLHKPRPEVIDNLSENERNEILSQLNPSQRIAVARQRGWI